MAVIVTNMDMQDRCLNCQMQYNEAMEGKYGGVRMNYFCAALAKFIGHELCTDKRPDCPLKSIEGLIEHIRTYTYKDTAVDIEDVIDIIKNYCE